jgi:Cu/Ag efflux pump CusA
MFKSLISFCLSRRPIVLVGVILFLGAGFVAFKMLNIEAYPNPTPVILEITAQASGLSAEEMERYYTRPMEIGLYSTPGIDISVRHPFMDYPSFASRSSTASITTLRSARPRSRCSKT